jgi:hypothetical protein
MNEYPDNNLEYEIYTPRHAQPEPEEAETPDPVDNTDYIYWARVLLKQQYDNKMMSSTQYNERLQSINEWLADDNS